MSQKSIARLAWIFCVLVILSAVWLAFLNFRYSQVGSDFFSVLNSVFTFAMLAIFAVVGALIVSHQPRNTVGWLMIIEAALVFVWPLDIYFNDIFQPTAQPTLIILLGVWVYMWMWIWYIFPLLFIPLFFPTGKLLTPRWRWVAALGLGLCLFMILFATFVPEFIAQDESWSLANPIGFITIEFPMTAWAVALLSFAGLCVFSLLLRYRRGSQTEKQQIKWLLYAAVLFFVIYSISFLFVDYGGFLISFVLDLAVILLPVAIGLAILRFRLYDIDIIIRKTLVYAILSGLLALTYFGLVVLLQSLFDSLSGEQSPFAIVISTLVIAALFNPLRRRLQNVIDQRFFRKKYDAQKVLALFSNSVRDETDIESLIQDLLQVVEETMQPEEVFVIMKVRR